MGVLRVSCRPAGAGFVAGVELERARLRRVAEARAGFGLSAQDREDVRWYLEDYLQYPAPAPQVAGRVQARLAELGADLFRQVFEANRDTIRLWDAVAGALDPPGSGVDYCRLHEARPHARMRATCTDGTNHRADSTRCAGIFLATRSTNRSTAEASMSPNVSRATCACHRPSGVATGSDVVEFPADAQGELPACGRASPSPSCGSLCGEGPGEVDAEQVAAPVVQKPLPVHLVDGHTGCDA